MKRLNITLPERVAEAIEVYQNKSKFIAEAINEKIENDKKEKLDTLLVEGYKSECNTDNKIKKREEKYVYCNYTLFILGFRTSFCSYWKYNRLGLESQDEKSVITTTYFSSLFLFY